MNKTLAALVTILLFASTATAYDAGDKNTWIDWLDEENKESLLSDYELVAAFNGSEIATPVFVASPDNNLDYYLVPFEKQETAVGVMVIDAQNGHFRGIKLYTGSEQYLVYRNKASALAKIKEGINPAPLETIALEFGFESESAGLVWKNGEYTKSPFDPYWGVQIEDGEWVIKANGTVIELNAITSDEADTNISVTEGVAPNSEGFYTAGKYYEISNTELVNGTFNVELTFSYDDKDDDGTVDGTEIDEANLNVYYWNGEAWDLIEGAERNAEENTITVTVNHFTVFALMQPEPAPEPEPQPAPQPAPTLPADTSRGNPGTGRGSSGGAVQKISITGNCAGEEITVSAVNAYDSPLKGVSVQAIKDRETAQEEKTGEDGIVSLELQEAGEYIIAARKGGFKSVTKRIDVVDCPEPEPENLCENVECDDKNPCTTDLCTAETGACVNDGVADGANCGNEKECTAGQCGAVEAVEIASAQPAEEQKAGTSTPTGMFTAGADSSVALIGAVLAIAIIGAGMFLRKNKRQ